MVRSPALTKQIIGAAFAVLIGASGVHADVISIRADIWCPYNCEPGSEHPGYMIEIAREALAPFGHTIDYQTLNWMRSIEKTRQGDVVAIVGAKKEDAPDFVFGPPLGKLADTIVARSGTTVDFAKAEPLSGLRLGAIRGYTYVQVVADYIERYGEDRVKVQFVSGDDAVDQNLRKLLAGRIDVVVEDINVLRQRLTMMGVEDKLSIFEIDVPQSSCRSSRSTSPSQATSPSLRPIRNLRAMPKS